ncbi:conserved hypothetical protein [Thioalkalivibrio sulfidiphilus HL-EbGr7]|uniref:Uncharacterized protein n=1 Tax=Thioalkalivibrio sulfidiphilus (strain HL-EbGR7) TaxID=396588 RepID=B8GU27_THISH|nr:hypothetical protein [Thioalkalivibrio sulfidiphilus]ACL71310.1 conserved hypothetical protein [Thioalkalivibrio sulfidiphilus HL-EbGr7]
MAVDSRELRRRRRAIYTGLCSLMDEAAAREGLGLWEREFSDKPVYALHDFLARICRQAGQEARRGELHRALVRALSLDEADLAPDPGPSDRGAVPAASASPPPPAGAMTVFESMYGTIMEGLVQRQVETGVRVRVLQRLVGLGLPAGLRGQVTDWITGEASQLPQAVGLEGLRGLLHLTYVAACEEVGPVSADRLLAEAVRVTEKLGEAEVFSPRALL